MSDRYATMGKEQLRAECRRLDALINEPSTGEFFEAVRTECAHQRVRWGEAHDQFKSPAEFAGTAVYLLGKALSALWDRNFEKGLHHIVTTAALCSNWFRIEKGRK